MDFPQEINKYIAGLSYELDTVGRSDDQVIVIEDKYILKISLNSERLLREKTKIDWLSLHLSGAKSICYVEYANKYYYLRTEINGYSLIDEKFINNPKLLIDILVNVVAVLRSLDGKNCPYKAEDNIGNDFIHGDLCLPNIYVNDNNDFIGFIDLENSGLGDKWYDYSWLLWSLEYNLKTNKYNDILLKRINEKFNQAKYELYINDNKNFQSDGL